MDEVSLIAFGHLNPAKRGSTAVGERAIFEERLAHMQNNFHKQPIELVEAMMVVRYSPIFQSVLPIKNALLTLQLQRYDELMTAHPFERLLMDLLNKEDNFERQLAVEHVDDKLINKQVVLRDEKQWLEHPRVIGGAWNLVAEQHANPYMHRVEFYLYKILAFISLMNRQRRNARLLKDWTYGRPW